MGTGLEVEGLAIGRAERRLLSGVRLSVAPGTALSIHGTNGLGKTTLLRTLAGLMPPLEGRLTHDPEDVIYTAHGDAVKAGLTVAENLRFWAQLYGQGDIAPALAAFSLGPLAARRGDTLSAGQRRRCALARLVLAGRSIWLLDEPTAALDTNGQAELAAALTAQLAGGGVALLVTHGEPPIACPRLDLTAFRAGPPDRVTGAFAEALE